MSEGYRLSNIAVLESEISSVYVSSEDLAIREELAAEFRQLPDEAFIRLRHLQPQIGCWNKCKICSQKSGSQVWHMNPKGLKNFFPL